MSDASTPELMSKAGAISASLSEAGYNFDPLTILSILLSLIRIYMACTDSPAKAARRAKNPRWLDHFRLRKLIHDCGVTGTEDVEVMEAAVLDAADDLTVDEMKTMYEEAKR